MPTESYKISSNAVNQSTGSDNLTKYLDNIGVTKSHITILVLVLLGGFFEVFEQQAISSVGPSIQEDWGLSSTSLGFLNTATFGSMVIGGLLAGILSDSKGRKTLFTFNLGLYSLGGLISAFAPNYLILVIGRTIVGLGIGGEITIAITLLAEISPTFFRGRATSLFNVGSGGIGNFAVYGFAALMTVLAPALGLTDWRLFFGLLALPALLILYLRKNLPETPLYLLSKGRVKEANKSLSVLAQGRLNPKGLKVTNYLTDADRVMLGHSKTRFSDVFRGKRLKSTLTLGMASVMTFGAQNSVMTFMPLILVERGYSVANSLIFTMVINFGSLLGAIFASYINFKQPRRRVSIIGSIIALIVTLAFGFLANSTSLILIIGFLVQFLILMLNTTIWTWSPEVYPTQMRSFGSGIIINAGLGSMAVAPPIAGLIFESFGINGLFTFVSILFVCLIICVIFAPETFGKELED